MRALEAPVNFNKLNLVFALQVIYKDAVFYIYPGNIKYSF